MTEKILVPVLGESITEATISKWLKNKGDSIRADEPIEELETDKDALLMRRPTVVEEVSQFRVPSKNYRLPVVGIRDRSK